jgi:hypothetical protein
LLISLFECGSLALCKLSASSSRRAAPRGSRVEGALRDVFTPQRSSLVKNAGKFNLRAMAQKKNEHEHEMDAMPPIQYCIYLASILENIQFCH